MGKYSSSYLDKLKKSNPGLVEVASNLASSANERAKYKRDEEARNKRIAAVCKEISAAQAAVERYQKLLEGDNSASQSFISRYGGNVSPKYNGAERSGEIRAEGQAPTVSGKYYSDSKDYAMKSQRTAVETQAKVSAIREGLAKSSDLIDRTYGKGTAEKMKKSLGEIESGAWQRSNYAKQSADEMSQFTNQNDYDLWRIGWTAGKYDPVDPKYAADRVEKRASLQGQISAIDEELKSLNGMQDDARYSMGPANKRRDELLKQREELVAQAKEYDLGQGLIDKGDIGALDKLNLFGGTAETRTKKYEELLNERMRLGIEIQEGESGREEVREGTLSYKRKNPVKGEEYVVNGKKTGRTKQQRYEELDALIKQYERFQRPLDNYQDLQGKADFENVVESVKSKVLPEMEKYEREYYANMTGNASGWYGFWEESGLYHGPSSDLDPLSKYLAQVDARERIRKDDSASKVTREIKDYDLDADKRGWQYLRTDELNNYYFLLGTEGEDAAMAYLNGLENILGKRAVEGYQSGLDDVGTLQKIFLNVAAIPYKAGANAAAFVGNKIDQFSGEEISPYSGPNLLSREIQGISSNIAEDLDKKLPWVNLFGQSAGDIYQGVQSGMESGVFRGAFGPASVAVMGLGAAVSTEQELFDKGASDRQIATGGFLSGVAEALFEYVSLEVLFKNFLESSPTSVLDFVKKALVQMGVEGSEEVATDIANLMTDYLNMHSQSEVEQMIKEYTDQGYSRGEAFGKTFWNDIVGGKLNDAFWGGVFGTMFSSAGTVVQGYIQNSATGSEIINEGAGKSLQKAAVDLAETEGLSPKYAETVRRAAERAGENPSPANVGFMSNAVERAVNEGFGDNAEASVEAGTRVLTSMKKQFDVGSATVAETGKDVTIDKSNPIARIDGNKIYMNTSEGVKQSTGLDFKNDVTRAVVNAMSNTDVTVANAILRNYEGGDPASYVSGMKQGIFYGEYGTRENMTAFDTLNKAQQKIAVDLGRANRAENMKQSQTATTQEYAPAADETLVRSFKRKGAFGSYGQVYRKGTISNDLPNRKINDKTVRFVSDLLGSGAFIEYDSTDKNLKDEDLKNANGKFVYKNDAIYVDMAAGNTSAKGLVAFALSHEITHLAEKWASKEYQQYAEWLVKTYDKRGLSVQGLIQKYMNDYGYGEKEALSEIVAESSEKLINDPDLFTTLESLREESPTVWEKVVKTIKGLFDKLVNAYKGLEPESLGASIARDFFSEEDLKEQRDKWRNLMVAAAQNRTEAVKKSEAAKKSENTFVDPTTGEDVRWSRRTKEPPKNTMIGYKVFVVKDGKLYPPMVANPGGADTPVGVWLDADIGQRAPDSKTGRMQVKAGGKGTQGGSGSLAFRPGWHLGEVPLATQFDRVNPETGNKELFPANFVWAECEIAADHNYQDEAMSYGYTKNGKFQHSLAGLPKLPVDGYYQYRTNPNPNTVPWLITGSMKVNRLLSDAEVNDILAENGLSPKMRQGGNKTLEELGLGKYETAEGKERFSRKISAEDSARYLDLAKDPVKNEAELSRMVEAAAREGDYDYHLYHGTNADFTKFDLRKFGGRNGKGEGYGIYLAANKEISAPYGKNLIDSYVKFQRLAEGSKRTLTSAEVRKIIKTSCEAEANRSVEDGEYDSFEETIKDSWVSNYVYTYEYGDMNRVYADVAEKILQANSNDGDIINEIMIAAGAHYNYDAALDFYDNVLTPVTGIDGFHYIWGTGTENANDIYLAFHSEQIKKADPVVYDDHGNVIPLEDRFRDDRTGDDAWKNEDIRYSRKISAEERDANLKRWFGDSKVVNEDGTPKVVYHGTNAYEDFYTFKAGKKGYMGPGIYVTENRGIADRYANQDGGRGRVYEVYAKIETPLTVKSADPAKEILRTIYGSDSVYNRRAAKQSNTTYLLTKADMAKLQGKGYDGIIWEYGTSPKEYLVFDSSQLKSATDNIGTFDRNEKDIRYSRKQATSYSTRAVVERALKTLDKASVEYRTLSEYKKTLDSLDAEKLALREARRAGDKSLMTQARNRINILNDRLARMESSKSLKNVAGIKDVVKLNEDIKDLGEKLRYEASVTDGTMAQKRSVEAAATKLMKMYNIKRGKAELVELLSKFYTKIVSENDLNTLKSKENVAARWTLEDAANDASEWLLNNIPVEKTENAEIKEVLDFLKGKRVRVNDDQKGNIKAKFGSFDKWRKSLYPYIIVTSDPSATTLDSLWNDELSAQYPERFKPDISFGDQGIELANVLSELKADRYRDDEADYYREMARPQTKREAASAIADAFWTIKPYETIGDRYQKRIDDLKAKHRERLQEERKSFRETLQEQKEKAYERGMKTMRRRRERTELRQKIRNLTENMSARLVKPKVNKYIPVSLQTPVAKVLGALDIDTGRSERLSDKLAVLQKEYEKIGKTAEGRAVWSPAVKEIFDRVIARIGDTAVKDMTVPQLTAVYDALRTFDHVVRDSVKAESLKNMVDDELTVGQIGDLLIEEANDVRDRRGLISDIVNIQLRPSEFFETLAGYKKNSFWSRMYQMLNNAQRKQLMYEMESNQIFGNTLKDLKYLLSLSDTKNLVDIGLTDENDKPFPVTHGMMLSIYKHLLNEDNTRHIMVGGLMAPDMTGYYKGKTNAYDRGTRIPGVIGQELAEQYDIIEGEIEELDDQWEMAAVKNDFDTMDAIDKQRKKLWGKRDEIIDKGKAIMEGIRKNIESELSDQDREFIRQATEYFDKYARKILNEATMQMYGFEKARVNGYFPIHVDSDFLGANFESVSKDFALENSGFMKDRVASSKPIMLEDFSSVIDSQISKVARYAALTPALRDFEKIYGSTQGGVEATGSVQKAISRKTDGAANKYIDKLMGDLNGGVRKETSLIDRLRSRVAGAVLAVNPRVSLVQAASYITAASELGYGALTKALLKPENSLLVKRAPTELIEKYTAMLWTRKQGYTDVAMGEVADLAQKRKLLDRKLKWLTGWIQAFDTATVGRLWYAAEYYVDDKFDLEKGSDEYYMKVAEVFNNVIERTQPNYTVMQRPAVLRSTNALVKALTMFMTQRLQNTNILYGAAKRYAKYSRDYNNGKDSKNGVTKEDVREARKGLTRALSSQILSAATIAGMKLVADMLLRNMYGRRDDDKEVTGESIALSVLNDFLSTLMSNFLGGSEIYDTVESIATGGKYYGVSIGGVDSINNVLADFVKAVQGIANGKSTPKNWLNLATDVSTLVGIPLGNVYKIAKALKGWGEAFIHEKAALGNAFDYGTGDLWEKGPVDRTNEQKANLIVKAYNAGNHARVRELRDTFDNWEKADSAIVDKVYGEWSAGKLTDREALDILEGTLTKAPANENEERIRIEKWETRKENEGKPKDEKDSYSSYDDLTESFTDYVYAEEDRGAKGVEARKTIDQYKEWGYTDEQIKSQITSTFKSDYVAMSATERAKVKKYIATLYEMVGKDRDKANKDIDRWVKK